MSSSAEGEAGGPACRKCGARPAGRAWLFVLGMTVATLGLAPFDRGPLCAKCGAGYDFVGLLMLAFALVVGFVLVVVLVG